MTTPTASAAAPTAERIARDLAPTEPETGLRRCTLLALLLAAAVVALGAYVRLNDAGLSCPDWPGCYGRIAVPAGAPDAARAHLEMTHRYLAGSLGLLIAAIFVLSWRRRRPAVLPTLLLATVLGQALLGRWTVTGLLQPEVVTAHLVGGFTTLALLGWLTLRHYPMRRLTVPRPLRAFAALVLCATAGQVMLGGWTSANNAALACAGFPQCRGQWWPKADFRALFTPAASRSAGIDDGAQVAIHWTHRLGALTVTILAIGLSLALWRRRRAYAALLLLLLTMQLSLGITVVLLQRPLAAAVAHSFVAAMLVLCLVAINVALAGRRP